MQPLYGLITRSDNSKFGIAPAMVIGLIRATRNMAANKLAKRPKLDSLNGASTISLAIRDVLNIPNGVLTAPFKELGDVKRLIADSIQSESYPSDANVLYHTITGALNNISKLVIKEERNSEKGTFTKAIILDGNSLSVPQAYCKNLKSFMENEQMKKKLKLEYAKAIMMKRREEKRKSREEEVEVAQANLVHKDQMLMYSAADTSYYGIKANLEQGASERNISTVNDEINSDEQGLVNTTSNNGDENDEYQEKEPADNTSYRI